MNDKLLRNFMHDTKTFLDRLGAQLLQLEKEPDNGEILEQCFRTAHSLKSEASYMDYEGMTRTAHNLESALEDLRTGKSEFSTSMMEEMLGWVDALEEQAAVLRSDYSEELEFGLKNDETDSDGPELKSDMSSALLDVGGKNDAGDVFSLDDFQREILKDAQMRGELYYRLICELDPDLLMKYAKAYLLVNNLELIVNVVKVIPSMDDTEADFSELNILFTSAVSEGEIFRAVNVDQVRGIQLAGLNYENSGGQEALDIDEGEEDSDESRDSRKRELRIDSRSLETMSGYLEELRFLFHSGSGAKETGLKLLDGIEKVLSEIPHGPRR